MRATDRANDQAEPGGLKNEYLRVQSFNADETRLLVRGTQGGWYLYDAQALQPLGPLPVGDYTITLGSRSITLPVIASDDDVVAEAHRLGLRVLIDIVANHTSDRHPWFQDALTSRDAAQQLQALSMLRDLRDTTEALRLWARRRNGGQDE